MSGSQQTRSPTTRQPFTRAELIALCADLPPTLRMTTLVANLQHCTPEPPVLNVQRPSTVRWMRTNR